MTILDVKINVRQVEALADRLQRIDGTRLGNAALEAVNAVAVRAEASTRRGGLADINLTDTYVKSKTDVALGTNPGQPRAVVEVKGSLTTLGRFAGTVWYRQPGAPRRAGPVKGRRSAGVYANIKNSDRLNEGQWFMLPLKRGVESGGNGYGVFVRKTSLFGQGKNDYGKGLGDAGRRRDGKYGKAQIYGPSPYMLFRKQIIVQEPQLARDLADTVVGNITAAINKA